MNILILILLFYNNLSTNIRLLIICLLLCSNSFNSNQSTENISNNDCNFNSCNSLKKTCNNQNQDFNLLNRKSTYQTSNNTSSTNSSNPTDPTIYYCYDDSGNLIPYEEYTQ